MPKEIRIEEDDIRRISHFLRCNFQDEHRQSALQTCESMDIQACPGSGKTTLLVAKLALLAYPTC